jgi:hypothetical protein
MYKPTIDKQIEFCKHLQDFYLAHSKIDGDPEFSLIKHEFYKAIGDNLIVVRMLEGNPVNGKPLFSDSHLPWIVRVWNQIFSPRKQRG